MGTEIKSNNKTILKNFLSSIANRARSVALLATLSIFLFTVIGAALPSRTFADAYTAKDPSQEEYIQWVAATIIVSCASGKDELPINNATEDGVVKNLFGDYIITPGMVFSRFGINDNDNEMHCDNISEMKKIVGILGAVDNSLRDFQDKIAKSAYPELTNPSKFTAAKFNEGFSKYMTANKLGGDGGSWDKLSNSALFWYWNQVYRTRKVVAEQFTGETDSCQGTFSNSSTASGTTQISGTYYSVSRKDSNSPFIVNERKYGYFEQQLDTQIGNLDWAIYTKDGFKPNCEVIAGKMTKDRAKAYADRLNNRIAAGEDVAPTTSDPDFDDAASATDESCAAKSGDLGWALCPIINIVGGALEWIDEQLVKLLEVDRDKYATGTNSENLYATWAQFRNIGLTLLIAAMLVMVISTALGIGALDAYTVKKAFPRMVAAVIFMTLSWYVCVFLIGLSNVVGRGVLGLMTSPFTTPSGGKIESLSSLFTASGTGATVQIGATLTSAVVVYAIGGAAVGILLSWLATGLLIMGIAFIVLVARQMFVLVLILFAPVAILSWIFPGNDKLWKFWWQSFSKLLLMFPMVMALIAAGRIFAGVIVNTNSTSGGESLLNTLLKFTAYVIPYAFIPFTFKAAGGVFGNLVGMANDRSRGAFDRLKKGRQKSMGELGQRADQGQLFKSKTGFGAFSNRVVRNTKAGPGNNFGLGAKGRTWSDEAGFVAAEDKMKTKEWQGAQFKDDAMRALMTGNEAAATKFLTSRGVTGTALNEALATARRIGYSKTSQIAAVQQLAKNKTGFKNATEAMGAIDTAAGGNESLKNSLKENVKYLSKQVGRNDLGALRNRNAGENDAQWNASMTTDGFENLDPYSLGREHAKSYENMTEVHTEQYANAAKAYLQPGGRTTENYEKLVESRTKLEETLKNLSSATGKNARFATGKAQQISDTDLAVWEETKETRDRTVLRRDPSDPNKVIEVKETYEFSPIIGELTQSTEQGVIRGQVGSSPGLARAQDEEYRRARDRENK